MSLGIKSFAAECWCQKLFREFTIVNLIVNLTVNLVVNTLSSKRFDAKRHDVILAKALDGIWLVGHACAVLCWGTRRRRQSGINLGAQMSLCINLGAQNLGPNFRSASMIFINSIFKNHISELQISRHLSPQPSGRRKT